MLRFVTFALLCVSAVSATEFRSCTGGQPTANSVVVAGCDALPCDLIRGQDANILVDFTTAIPADDMTPLVLVTIAGLTINYPLEQQDACANLVSGGCPLNPGDNAIYDLTMPILNSYPLVSLRIEFSLLDKDGDVVTCIEFDGQVVDP